MAAIGCTRGGPTRVDSGDLPDMGSVDAGLDAPGMSCTIDAQCDDHVMCTLDQCVVGNVCAHMPINSMCPMGQHCGPSGCTSGTTCTASADCDDHVYCNGVETCQLHQCIPGTPIDCSTGDPCHVGSCDEATMSCTAMVVCDSGVGTDTGPTCTPFTAPDDFNGIFALFPVQSQGCPGANYDVAQVTLTVNGTGISATTGPSGGITLSGTISGNGFSLSGTQGGNSYTLTGSFTCRERFMGHWTASLTGFGCVSQDVDVSGFRR
jgi:hypothetical protein